MKTTLRDVASHLNLSPALVSRVLNDKPGVWASAETRQRVIEAAQTMAYRPSASARALATGRSMQLALVVEMTQMGGVSLVVQPDVEGLVMAAAAKGYRVVLLPLQPGREGEVQLEHLARDRWCDGVCLFSHELSRAHLAVLEKHDIPRVIIGDCEMIDGEPVGKAMRVDHDNYRYAYESVVWLQEQGHRKIAWAMAHGEVEQPHNVELNRGYMDAMQSLGARPQILPAPGEGDLEIMLRERDFTAVIVRYLPGIYSWLYWASMLGVKVPEDLMVLGQVDYAQLAPLSLTGLTDNLALHCYDSRRAGERAGEILIEWAAGISPTQRMVLVGPHPPGWGQPEF